MTTRECTRCGSERAAGGQCSRRTCIYAKRCWQHTKKTEQLQIKPSKIQGAGKGLITPKKRKNDEARTIGSNTYFGLHGCNYLKVCLVLESEHIQHVFGW